MSIWQFLKRWRANSRRKRKFFNIMGSPMHLTAQEKRSRKRSSSLDADETNTFESDPLYQAWLDLSRREQDVTALTCLGYTNSQIAARLGLSIETIRSYLDNVFYKTKTHSKADLRVLFALWDFSAWERRKDPYR